MIVYKEEEMIKFIPYEKLSRKKQKELNAKKRNSWGMVKPITKSMGSKKVYNRKDKSWENEI